MLRNYFVTLVLFFSFSTLWAQGDSIVNGEKKSPDVSATSTRLPARGNFGFTFNFLGFLDTISVGSFKDFIGNEVLLARYYLEDNRALRLGSGINLINGKASRVDSATSSAGAALIDSNYTAKRTDVYLSPGYEFHMKSGKNLDPYFAALVTMGKIGRSKERLLITTTDTIGTSVTDITYDQDGGFELGLNFIAGVNYFIAEKLSIGAEYGFGVSNSRLGGDWNRVTIDTPSSGSQIVKNERGSLSTSVTRIKMNSNAGIMLSYYF